MKRIAMLLPLLPALMMAPPAKAGAPSDLTGVNYTQKIGARLPLDIVLRDEAARSIHLAEALAGRPAILLFGYFHCRKLCAVLRAETLEGLLASGLVGGRDYRLLAISVDASETSADAAEAKAKDIETFPAAGAEVGWRYLTGDAAQLERLRTAVGFDYVYDAERKSFTHPIGRVLLDPEGVLSGYLFGLGADAATLRGAISRAAAKEGVAASPVALFCFDYDPATGRYTLAIMKVARLLCAGAVLLFAGYLYKSHAQRRRAV